MLRSIRARLLVAYLGLTLVCFGLFGAMALRDSSARLEGALGRRLTAVAQAAATQVKPNLIAFLEVGDDESRSARRLAKKLQTLRKRCSVARIVVIDARHRSYADTAGKLRIGDRYYHAEADRVELQQVMAGQEASSLMFRGANGVSYKTGYAPVSDGQRVVAAVAVEGSARFLASVSRLREYLLLAGVLLATLVVILTAYVSRRITGPLSRLTMEAQRIGSGDLQRPVESTGRDETALLAKTMNEMRDRLLQRNQQLQQMLAGIAHEVRNPLGGMELFAGLLAEALKEQPDKVKLVKRIRTEIAYLTRVVNEFLDYARDKPPRMQCVRLDEIVRTVEELIAADAQAAGVLLRMQLEPVSARVDPDHVRQILLNLLRNALQVSPSGSSITVTCGQTSAESFLEVVDQGPGIGAENRSRIFEPFFTTREKGTGLGLALSKKLAESNGGQLRLQSDSHGCSFRLDLKAD